LNPIAKRWHAFLELTFAPFQVNVLLKPEIINRLWHLL